MRSNAIRWCVKAASSLAVVAVLFSASAGAPAQNTASSAAPYHLDDPANLAGERVSAQDLADTLPINHGAPALQQLLLKLRTRASFMLIVAHPDDEDGGLLTYLSRGQGARVAMLTLNRGEGGQNLMSADFDDALGLIRTQELLAADRYMGVDQFFGSVVDFGFSKTKEESLAKWTHERVLYDAVRAVRLYRPLVIASVWVGGPTDGHGQHQVSGEIAQEVFNAAADPNVFPEMIQQGLPPWAPLKVYARARGSAGAQDPRGIFDSATGKYSPARFFNYVTQTWSDTAPKAAVIIHEGDPATYTNPDGSKTPIPGMDGQSYVQFARRGLAMQKSQNGGGGRGGGGGVADSGYARYGSRIPNSPVQEQTLYDGIDTSLPGIATLAPEASGKFRPLLEKIDGQVAEAQRLFDPAKPELTAPPLRLALGALDQFIHELEDPAVNDLPPEETYNLLHELRVKRIQANNALLLAHGLTLEATLANTAPNQNDQAESLLTTQRLIKLTATLHSTAPVDLVKIGLQSPSGVKTGVLEKSLPDAATTKPGKPIHLSPGQPVQDNLRLHVESDLPATRPYFSRPNTEQPFYDIAIPALRDAPETPPPFTVTATLNDNGVPLELDAIVSAAPAPPSGELARQPLSVVPPVSITLPVSAAVVPVDKDHFPLSYSAFNSDPEAAPELHLELPPNWTYTLPPAVNQPRPTHPPMGRISHGAADVKTTDVSPYRPYPITVVAELDGRSYREGFRSVGYPGLQSTDLYTPSIFHVAATGLHTAPNLHIAYLPGTGDDVPAYLPDLGIAPTILTLADLTAAKLAQFDAVLLGVRAYAAHPELAGAGSQPLLEYAKNGGVVIVQYNTARYGDADAPYPISVPGSADMNVVEEADRVTILAPQSPLLTWPNRITSADFEGWVEERGHGFARSWAPEYQPLLEMHDPGQDPEKGGLLVAHTGKGYYIYTALALYRQLPEGVPGAYRLFANLLSLGKNPGTASPPPPAK